MVSKNKLYKTLAYFGRDSREIGGTCVLYYSFSENKGADQLQGSASLFSYIQNVVFL